MSINTGAIISKLGTPGQRKMQDMKNRSATQRLLELATTQQKHDDEQARLEAGPKNMFGSPMGSSFSMRDYTDNLNREGEIVDLASKLSGGGGKLGGYGGTYGSPAAPTRSLGTGGGGGGSTDDDLHRHRMQQMDIEDRINARESGAIAGLRRLEADPDFDLFSGRTAARTSAVGDIQRSEAAAGAKAKTQAEIDDYFAKEGVRRDQAWYARRDANDMMPFNKDILAAQAKLGVAGIGADARIGAAQIGADARTGSSAIGALGRMAGTPTFSPDDAARLNEGIGTVQQHLPGAAGGQPTQAFPKSRLPELMQQYGWTEAQAIEFMQLHGYRLVDDAPAAPAAPAPGRTFGGLGGALSGFLR